MKKLLFAIFIAVLALVIAMLGLKTGEKVKLSLNLGEGKAYKVWINCDKNLEMDQLEEFPRPKWDESIQYGFGINPNPDDTLFPGKYRMGGMSGSGGGRHLMPPFGSKVDTTDLVAVRRHYVSQLPRMAANCITTTLIPWYYHHGFRELKAASVLVAEPYDDEDVILDERMKKIPKRVRIMFPNMMEERLGRFIDRTLDRIEKLYPDRPISVGDSWQVKNDSVFDIPINEVITLTCKDRKGGRVTLELQTKAGTGSTPARVDTLGVILAISFHAEQTGTIEMDESTGLVPRGDIAQKVEGELRVEQAAGFETDKVIPFTISGNFRIEFAEAPDSRFLESRTGAAGTTPGPALRDSSAAADTANPGTSRRAYRRIR